MIAKQLQVLQSRADVLAILLVIFLAGCDTNDVVVASKVNDSNWAVIGIGQDKSLVTKVMGKPDEFKNRSILGVENETLVWKSHFPNREYTAELVMGRVVSKNASNVD